MYDEEAGVRCIMHARCYVQYVKLTEYSTLCIDVYVIRALGMSR